MMYQVSEKLKPFLHQVNTTIAELKAQAAAKGETWQYEVAATRAGLDNLAQLMSEKPTVDFVADRAIEFAGHSVPARVYHPAPEQELPVLLHFHGGGHMCGSVELYDPISRKLAALCQVIVIAIDYRLAPEHPYPAGINDCELALKNYQQVLQDLPHNNQINIIGDSAGGAICTTLAAMSLSDPNLNIEKQILIYPSVDYTSCQSDNYPSMQQNATGFLLEKAKVEWYFEQYFQTDNQQGFKEASALFKPFNNKLPSSLIFTAGCDPLRDEGQRYAEKLQQAGVKVEHHQFNDMIHAYMLLNDLVKEECNETYRLIRNFIHH